MGDIKYQGDKGEISREVVYKGILKDGETFSGSVECVLSGSL